MHFSLCLLSVMNSATDYYRVSKKPNPVVFWGFIGFWALLGFSDFLSQQTVGKLVS